MSWNNIMPFWAIGNPWGPTPTDGKYWYQTDSGKRMGPFDSREQAQAAKDADPDVKQGLIKP